MGHKQLSIEDREVIMKELGKGSRVRAIGRELGRAASTVSREIRRNDRGRGYGAHRAQTRALDLRHKPRRPLKLAHEPLRQYVDQKLRQYWSPEQIAGRLQHEGASGPMRISHETIYRFIQREAERGVSYERYLRQGHRRHSYGWRGKRRFKRIRNTVSIEQRPAVVAERSRLGDWESDTLRGQSRKPAGIATHVERKSRYLLAAKLESRKAKAYNEATIRAFEQRADLPRHTLTVDHGMEFSEFKTLEEALKVQVFFATPYHAWERGTNENTNGLLRQFFPKRRDLTGVHPRELEQVVQLLNHRPRKCLGYRTPTEALREDTVAFGS